MVRPELVPGPEASEAGLRLAVAQLRVKGRLSEARPLVGVLLPEELRRQVAPLPLGEQPELRQPEALLRLAAPRLLALRRQGQVRPLQAVRPRPVRAQRPRHPYGLSRSLSWSSLSPFCSL